MLSYPPNYEHENLPAQYIVDGDTAGSHSDNRSRLPRSPACPTHRQPPEATTQSHYRSRQPSDTPPPLRRSRQSREIPPQPYHILRGTTGRSTRKPATRPTPADSQLIQRIRLHTATGATRNRDSSRITRQAGDRGLHQASDHKLTGSLSIRSTARQEYKRNHTTADKRCT